MNYSEHPGRLAKGNALAIYASGIRPIVCNGAASLPTSVLAERR